MQTQLIHCLDITLLRLIKSTQKTAQILNLINQATRLVIFMLLGCQTQVNIVGLKLTLVYIIYLINLIGLIHNVVPEIRVAG